MSAVLQEERDTIPWRSKVDDQGQTHVYKRIAANSLRVGDHMLEHVTGHAKPVATPILGIQHVADGVIVTIPDRHADNAPVDELYAFNKPLVISKTPHLEQHDPNQNLFFQMERKGANMEKQTPEIADEIGIYHPASLERKEVTVEKQTEVKKQQDYPRLDAHLKTPEGTWHSVGLYVNKEGQARGVIAVGNKDLGIAEKHSVQFAEKVSEKTGEKFLSAKVDRENGKMLYINVVPREKKGTRFLSASFAERDPGKERGQQLSAIEGRGGILTPNGPLFDKLQENKADKDRTAQYVRDTLKVDLSQVYGPNQAVQGKGSHPGKGLGE